MKELVKNYKISFRWWRSDKKPIVNRHVELLNEEAWQRIMAMANEGCTSGELITDINEIAYDGHWEIKEEK